MSKVFIITERELVNYVAEKQTQLLNFLENTATKFPEYNSATLTEKGHTYVKENMLSTWESNSLPTTKKIEELTDWDWTPSNITGEEFEQAELELEAEQYIAAEEQVEQEQEEAYNATATDAEEEGWPVQEEDENLEDVGEEEEHKSIHNDLMNDTFDALVKGPEETTVTDQVDETVDEDTDENADENADEKTAKLAKRAFYPRLFSEAGKLDHFN